MFSCKVCSEKDKRITDLLNEVQFLRSSLYPAINVENLQNAYEADVILSGNTPLTPVTDAELEDVISERDRLLAGNE